MSLNIFGSNTNDHDKRRKFSGTTTTQISVCIVMVGHMQLRLSSTILNHGFSNPTKFSISYFSKYIHIFIKSLEKYIINYFIQVFRDSTTRLMLITCKDHLPLWPVWPHIMLKLNKFRFAKLYFI
ncbi:unnamed protein product [Brassica oleracea]